MNRKSINRNVWALTLSLCLGVIGYSTLSAQATDPAKAADKVGLVGPSGFKLRLAATEKKLVGIEALLGRVESSRLITERDSDDFGKSMYEYAEEMNLAADTALKEAEKAFQGKGGDANLLWDFERTAKAHEARVRRLETRTQKIDTQLRAGTIKVDRPLLQKMSPEDREQFKKYLGPEGLKEHEKQSELFKDLSPSAAMEPGASPLLPEAPHTSLVPHFQAAIALQTATCIANCIAKGIADKNQAWQVYRACMDNAGACWKFWTWPKKAWCLVVYIARLA